MHDSDEMTPATGPPVETVTPAANATTPVANQESGKSMTISMEDDRFAPKAITIAAGTTVTWVNNGADWHSVAAFDGSFESGQISPGDSFSYTFTTPGDFSYICKHHGRQGMIGMITVTT
jgi:plastocyanin